jgi:hypothetical protein
VVKAAFFFRAEIYRRKRIGLRRTPVVHEFHESFIVLGARPSDPATFGFTQHWNERTDDAAAARLKAKSILDRFNGDREAVGDYDQTSVIHVAPRLMAGGL